MEPLNFYFDGIKFYRDCDNCHKHYSRKATFVYTLNNKWVCWRCFKKGKTNKTAYNQIKNFEDAIQLPYTVKQITREDYDEKS